MKRKNVFWKSTTYFLLIILFLNMTVCSAAISKKRYDELAGSYEDILGKAEKVREPTFWEKHKWVIIASSVVAVGGIIVFATGGTAAPAAGAATAGAAGTAACVIAGGAALLSPSAIFLGASSLVLVGSCFTESTLKEIAAKTFLDGKVVKYMKEHNIKLTEKHKKAMKKAIESQKKAFADSSSSEEEFLAKIDECALSVLKANL